MLDDFLYYFGAAHNTGCGIKKLTVFFGWCTSLAFPLTDAIKSKSDEAWEDWCTLDHLKSDIYRLTRIFSSLQHYKAELKVTFASASSARIAFIQGVCDRGKLRSLVFSLRQRSFDWWRPDLKDLLNINRTVRGTADSPPA